MWVFCVTRRVRGEMVKRYIDNTTDVGEQTNIISHSAPHSIASTSIYSSSTNYNQKDVMYPSEGQGCIYPIFSLQDFICLPGEIRDFFCVFGSCARAWQVPLCYFRDLKQANAAKLFFRGLGCSCRDLNLRWGLIKIAQKSRKKWRKKWRRERQLYASVGRMSPGGYVDQTRGTRARSAPPRGSRSSARGARPIQRVCGWKREQEARARRLHLLKSNNTYKNHINHII